MARWAVAALVGLVPGTGTQAWISGSLNLRLFAYALAVSAAAGLLFGCAPLLQTWRVDLVSALKEQTASGGARQLARKAMVALQLALAMVLLAGAGLFARALVGLKRTDPGFRTEGVLTFALQPQLAGYEGAREEALMRGLRERLTALPGVEAVAMAGLGPFGGGRSRGSLYVEGYAAAPDEEPDADIDAVSAGFFRALGIRIVAGREFDERDDAAAAPVAIVNEALARKYFRGRNPLGMRIGNNPGLEYRIVGVARDFHFHLLRRPAEPFVYLAHAQRPPPRTVVYIRGGGPGVGQAAQAVVRETAPGMPVTDMKSLERRIEEQALFATRSIAALAAAFGFLATVLAAVGLYGVVAYSVARRSGEMGLRMALGAAPGDIYRLVFRETAALVAAGALVGFPSALLLGRVAEAYLFDVKAYDPLPPAAALLLLAVVAAVAAAAPARKAARTDPVMALRAE